MWRSLRAILLATRAGAGPPVCRPLQALAHCPPGHCPHRPRKNPLFIVDLVLDSSGVHYSTPLEQFETSLLNLFDKGILATHAVPQLEKVQRHFEGWALVPGAASVTQQFNFITGLPPARQCAQPSHS